jgi:hypothetical protein
MSPWKKHKGLIFYSTQTYQYLQGVMMHLFLYTVKQGIYVNQLAKEQSAFTNQNLQFMIWTV